MQNLVREVREKIMAAITASAEKSKSAGQISFDQLPSFVLETPKDKAHGDFAANLAMLLTKQAKQPPRQLAQILVDNLELAGTWVSKVEIAGPGFINLYLDQSWVYQVLPEVLKLDKRYGHSQVGLGKKVQVEFVSANPTGLLHMGNARGAALGDTLANLLTASGHQVTREFYINDTGNQIENFGKSLEARCLQLMGQDVPFPEEGYHGQDIIDTMQNIINRDGDKYLLMDSAKRREEFIQIGLQEKLIAIKDVLTKFGVEYDVWFSEKTLHQSGAVQGVLASLQASGYIYELEGALWFKASAFGDDKDEVVVRGNGTPTYFAADIAYHQNKFERGFNRVINIWGADHHGHVARLKGAVKAVGYDPDSLDVILMQLVRLFKGGEIVRMSKRSGEFVTLDDLIDEVGKDAARYFFVMRGADSHLDFDLDLAKAQSAENPVFYVQYAHARICSILRQAKETGLVNPPPESIDFKLLDKVEELTLIRKLADLPEEIAQAAVNMEPHRIARYAHELAGDFHSFYNACRVMVEDEKLRVARLALLDASRITLSNTLHLLGLTAPERM
ncbi:MAG: arginine--tRNA ligase [Carboxydocellales bacterium]